MLAYFDTSALVPLVIDEATTRTCEELWQAADVIIVSSLAYVEAHAAIAQAARNARLTESNRRRALHAFAARWDDLIHIPPSDSIIRAAAELSPRYDLHGYDAVQCATALAAASDDLVAISGDRDLLRAWSSLGIATIDTAGLQRPMSNRSDARE